MSAAAARADTALILSAPHILNAEARPFWKKAPNKFHQPEWRSASMIGIGCLAPLVLFVLGALVGHFALGSSGVLWGAGSGFASGLVILGLLGWLLGKTKGR